MPCDTIQETSVDFNLEKTDTDILKEALENDLELGVLEDVNTIRFRGYLEDGIDAYVEGEYHKKTGDVNMTVQDDYAEEGKVVN